MCVCGGGGGQVKRIIEYSLCSHAVIFSILVHTCHTKHDHVLMYLSAACYFFQDNDHGPITNIKLYVRDVYIYNILDVCKTHAVQRCKEVQICTWYDMVGVYNQGGLGYAPSGKVEFLGYIRRYVSQAILDLSRLILIITLK